LVPEVALLDPSGDSKCLGSQEFRRVRVSEVWAVWSLEGHEPRRVATTRLGATQVSANGLVEEGKASKQVKLAVGAILPLVTQGNREAGLRTREKETHSS